MTRYIGDSIVIEADVALMRLRMLAIPDADLIDLLQPNMFAEHPVLRPVAWHEDEPEHESLVDMLHTQIEADIQTALLGSPSYCADHLLVHSYRPTVLTFIAQDNALDDEDQYDDEGNTPYGYNNPVQRLRALNICGPPTPEEIQARAQEAARALAAALPARRPLPRGDRNGILTNSYTTTMNASVNAATGSVTWQPVVSNGNLWANTPAVIEDVREAVERVRVTTDEQQVAEWRAANADRLRVGGYRFYDDPPTDDADFRADLYHGDGEDVHDAGDMEF